MANIITVLKVKPPKVLETDLRSISLTSTLSKLLETIVGDILLRWSKRRLIPSSLVRWRVVLQYYKINRHPPRMVLCNRLPRVGKRSYCRFFKRHRPRRSLDGMRVSRLLLTWIHSFLSDRRQRLKPVKLSLVGWDIKAECQKKLDWDPVNLSWRD